MNAEHHHGAPASAGPGASAAAPDADTAPGRGRPGRPDRPAARGRAATVAAIAAAAAGLALFVVPLSGVHLKAMNGLGLISVLPAASLAGLIVLVLAFAAMLARRRPAPVVLGLLLVAIIFCLDGVTAVIEPLPRFATSYQVYGFVNYIRHTGSVAPGVTAYFSWPGFFGLVSLAAQAAGAHSLVPLLTWWPFIIDTLTVLPFLLLTSAFAITWRARWLAALLLCAGNWVGQDYFAPQSLNYLLYLSFLAIVLLWFAGPVRARAGAQRMAGERPARPVGNPQRAILLLLLVGIFAASVVSHQLTPFLIIAACAALVIVGRCSPRGLPVLLAVIAIGWVSYATVGYWTGHLTTIFGGIGHLGGTFSSSVGGRLIGTPVHEIPVYGRLLLAGTILVLAALGVLRRRRRKVTDRALVILVIAPVSIAAVQNYGGEVSLRIYLFALPAAAILAALSFFPQTGDEPEQAGGEPERRPAAEAPAWRRFAVAGVAGVVAAGLAGMFILTRYGNEGFEQTPPSELAAMNYIYDHARGGGTVLWLSRPAGINATPQMPWQFRDVASIAFTSLDSPRNPSDTAGVTARLRSLGRGAFLVVTGTEATYLRQTASFGPAWARKFRESLSASPALRLVFNGQDAAVYQARLPASAPRTRTGLHKEVATTGSTIWSPVGLVMFGLAVVLLLARELIRECAPARRWLMRPLALAAVPAVVLFLVAVVERFRVIS